MKFVIEMRNVERPTVSLAHRDEKSKNKKKIAEYTVFSLSGCDPCQWKMQSVKFFWFIFFHFAKCKMYLSFSEFSVALECFCHLFVALVFYGDFVTSTMCARAFLYRRWCK